MNPVTTVEGRAYPLGRKNVDTDVIIPAQYLKTISRFGLGRGAFETVRAEPGNVFDREHAAWALNDMGVTAVIAPSFSDIFSGNAFKNGIVTVVLPEEAVERLIEVAKAGEAITIDLESLTVTTPFQDRFVFAIDAFRRHCLMNGLDEVGLTLARDAEISGYERQMAVDRPWLGSATG
jgi:3-isopropylmalate/(R)-2-methylmalate dehydratase small subunit